MAPHNHTCDTQKTQYTIQLPGNSSALGDTQYILQLTLLRLGAAGGKAGDLFGVALINKNV